MRVSPRPFIAPPLRALGWRWRWLTRTAAFRTRPVTTACRLARWTALELRGRDIAFTTPDGTAFVSMPNNFSSLAVYVDDYRDRPVQRFLVNHLRAGSVFVDAGANIGTYAVRAAQTVGRSGQVIAVEAHPVAFAMLQRNIALNGLGNVRAVHAALGAADGTVRIVYEAANPGETHVGTGDAGDAAWVRLRPLDSVLAELDVRGGVSYLKIDVEGYELPVLQGARAVIAASPAIVVQTELIDRHARRYGHSVRDVIACAFALGLKPHRLDDASRLVAVDADDLERGGDVLWTH